MGFGSASRAQQQATQQAMMIQAIANQQQQQQTRQAEQQARQDVAGSEARARADLLAGREAAAQAIREGRGLSERALREAQASRVDALRDYYARGVGFQQPYMGAGEMATNRLAALFGQGGEFTRQPTQAELEMDPGYAFRFGEGQRAMQSALGASGMRGSGAAMRAATRYGQEAGSQEYQNAYARFMANRQAVTEGLRGLYAGGLSAAGTASGLAGQTGSQLSDVYGTTGTNLANIYGTAAGNLGNIYTGTGGQLGSAALNVGSQLGANAMTTGQNLAALQGQLGQNLGQGYANIGAAQAQQAMGPLNMLASALGQGAQAAATFYGLRK